MTAAAPVLQGLYGHTIPLYTWLPERPEDTRFVVQIAHGMAEHAMRYERFARHLCGQGAVVIAHDHRGHGRAATSGVYGHYGDQNGWEAVTDDVYRVHQFARQQWPDVPHFLFAHSMGSFITFSSLLDHPYRLAGLIVSGSNHEPPLRVRAARQIAALERFRQGPRGKSTLIDHLSFGAFNKRFEPARTDFDWLSKDAREVDRYLDDPLCGFLCTNETWYQFLGGLSRIFSKHAFRDLPAGLPVLIVSGCQDPVGRYGEGPRSLERALRASPAGPVQCHLYPEGRHELLNDLEREQVMADIDSWLTAQLKVNH